MKHYGVPDLIRQLYMHSLNSLASTYFIFIEPHVSSTDTKLQVAIREGEHKFQKVILQMVWKVNRFNDIKFWLNVSNKK